MDLKKLILATFLLYIASIGCKMGDPDLSGIWLDAQEKEILDIKKQGTLYVIQHIIPQADDQVYTGALENNKIRVGGFVGDINYEPEGNKLYLYGKAYTKSSYTSLEFQKPQSASRDVTISPNNPSTNSATPSSPCSDHEYVVTITGDGVRMRSEPDLTKDNVITHLSKGTDLASIDMKEVGDQTWFKVCYQDKIGWVNSQFATRTLAADYD